MRKRVSAIVEDSPWRKAPDAMAYFQIGRNSLDRLATMAKARRKVGGSVLYNIEIIDKYLCDQL